MSPPSLSIVVPSHDRPLRLRWLLNALEEQDAEDWEVVVAHDAAGPETERLLRQHPLARDGRLRHLDFPPGSAGPAEKRNAGWRAARAPLIAFTDDDCRPPSGWVTSVLAAAAAHPGSIVQGRTTVDPDELVVLQHAPFARSQEVEPPVPWAQTCNILYPREVLEAARGFDESLPLAAGEDTDLALRARKAGATYVGEPRMLTHHAVEDATLRARMREVWRWQHLPFVTRRHPEVREHLAGGGYFWKPAHARVPFLLAGLALACSRRPLRGALIAAPWALASLPSYGSSPRGRLRAVSELPAHAVIDLVEVAALARGSVRHRSLLL
ncbi:MAG: glycosyltransferase family 2 protein [Solirubrobacterales bacterium]|nr:glycosyltransferase family 2 protein [Solirubrobacterales bacterium]